MVNICLFCSGSVRVRIGTLKMHVYDTCYLHDSKYKEQNIYTCEGSFWSPNAMVAASGLLSWPKSWEKKPHFGMGIIRGAIPMSFTVFWITVSGRSLNSYGTSPNLRVQKELVKFRQGTQDTWLRFAKFLREFLCYPPFNLLGDLGDVIWG